MVFGHRSAAGKFIAIKMHHSVPATAQETNTIAGVEAFFMSQLRLRLGEHPADLARVSAGLSPSPLSNALSEMPSQPGEGRGHDAGNRPEAAVDSSRADRACGSSAHR